MRVKLSNPALSARAAGDFAFDANVVVTQIADDEVEVSFLGSLNTSAQQMETELRMRALALRAPGGDRRRTGVTSLVGVELGVYTFAELRGPISPEQRARDLIEEVELADEVGLDVFGVGEHHRPDFVVSAPAVVLAAAAARTKRIRLTSAVTVLSSDDPVRVFEEFATVDLLSGGRAEIMAGRGSFIESFPLFGYDLARLRRAVRREARLLLALRAPGRSDLVGEAPRAARELVVYPRPVQDPLPVWVAVGGNPESAIRAGTLGLPLALAIIGGQPERFVPFAELHRGRGARSGTRPLPRQHQLARLRRRDVAAGRGRVLSRRTPR